MKLPQPDRSGWTLGPCVVIELCSALDFVRDLLVGQADMRQRYIDIGQQIEALSPDVRAQMRDALAFEGLHGLAQLAGVVAEGDYSRASLAMRELTLETALARATADAAGLGIRPNPDLPPDQRLVDLLVRTEVALPANLGLERTTGNEDHARVVMSKLRDLPRMLQGGDLHTRFWHWLDRFYFEFYRPWREARQDVMAAQERRALAALGAPAGPGQVPPLEWLAPYCPLHIFPTLKEAVQSGRIAVHFWVEPFGLFDSSALFPGMVMISFAEPGNLLERFQEHAEEVAQRTFALGDPTRLTILRIIRHYTMDNTQIANYLGLARPTVSIHAKALREAGLIETSKEGRAARHTIKATAIRKLFHDLEQFLDLPEPPEE